MLIYGANGYTKAVIECLISSKTGIKGIFDDEPLNDSFKKYISLGKYNTHTEPGEEIILAFEDNISRKSRAEQVSHIPGKAVHRSVIISMDSYIGAGTVILHNASILPDTKIGRYVIINIGSAIDRDCLIYDFAHVGQGSVICNNVIVGPGAHIGQSVTILPGVRIGEWAMVTAGSVIINDVPDFAIVAGNPGKIIRYRDLRYSKSKNTGILSNR